MKAAAQQPQRPAMGQAGARAEPPPSPTPSAATTPDPAASSLSADT